MLLAFPGIPSCGALYLSVMNLFTRNNLGLEVFMVFGEAYLALQWGLAQVLVWQHDNTDMPEITQMISPISPADGIVTAGGDGHCHVFPRQHWQSDLSTDSGWTKRCACGLVVAVKMEELEKSAADEDSTRSL